MSTKLAPEKIALHRAAEILGGQAALAVLLGYKDRRAVWPYFNTHREFPSEHCPIVERETRAKGEAILCEQLRPDVEWGVVRKHAAVNAGVATTADQTPDPVPDRAQAHSDRRSGRDRREGPDRRREGGGNA